MKIKSELDKIVAHLRETRKAILDKGGIIEPTCGLKDLPEAIWNIPADVSLTFIEDNSSAYEKIVPSNVEGYAYLSSVGCLMKQTNNLCIADGVYELNNETEKVFDLGVLKYGKYYISILGDIDGYTGMHIYANYGPDLLIDNSGAREGYFEIIEGEDTFFDKLTLKTDTFLNGTVTGIMLCKASDADKSYKPYQKPYNLCISDGYYELGSRPHNVEGQNIVLNLGELTMGIYQLQWYGTVSQMGPIEVYANSDSLLYYNGGDTNAIVFGLTGTDTVSFKLSSEAGYDNMWGDNYDYTDEEVDGFCWGEGSEITGIMLYRISDSRPSWNDVQNTEPITGLEYKAYVHNPIVYVKPTGIESYGVNTESIDVIEIPEEVQAIEGYGIGLSDNECNFIDFRRKVFVNDYEEVSGVVRKRENRIEIDLSKLFPKATTFLKVEGDGKIIFHNEHKQIVPSKIKYTRRME